MKAYLSTGEVAELLGVTTDKVTDWLTLGELRGVNVALRSGGAKPRWRISREALDDFLAARSSSVPPAVPARRRRSTVEPSYY